ncbi:Transthyretin-like family protein [Cooperia oncophora]
MIAAILLGFLLSATSAKNIRVDVRGNFHCENNPDTLVFVELREFDAIKDDVLGWTTATTERPFSLTGTEDEMFGINPYIVIKHSCRGANDEVVVYLGHVKADTLFLLEDVNLEDAKLEKTLQKNYVRSEPLDSRNAYFPGMW